MYFKFYLNVNMDTAIENISQKHTNDFIKQNVILKNKSFTDTI